MDGLDYQDLLSKCIQSGYWKSSSVLQGKAEPAVGTARLLENSTRGCREDTSGAAQGPPAKSVSGHRVVTEMDGIAMNKCRLPFIATPKSAGKTLKREGVLRSEDLKIDGFAQSFLKSSGMVTKTPPSTFSFRNLLEGAISTSRVKPSTSVQKMAESGTRSASLIEFEKDCVSGGKYPLSGERLIEERHDGVVSGRSMPQVCGAKVFSVEGLAKSWKGEGHFAHRVRDSGSLSGDTGGDSAPHVSYSSLLQAQLGDGVDDVRTESPQKTAGSSHVDAEAHYSLLNWHLHSVEVEGGFSPLLEKTLALRPSFAHRACFRAADSVPVAEQASDAHHSDKPSNVSAGAESRSADKVLEGDVREPLRATANPASPVLTGVGEDVSRAVVVVELGNSLVVDTMCIAKGTLKFQLPEGNRTDVAEEELRFADILSEKGALNSSEAAVVPATAVATRIEEHASPAEVVGEQGSSCVDEMSDAQLLEELSRDLAADEARFAKKALNKDTLISSEVAAVSASTVSANTDESDARALVVRERSAIVAADFVSTDERILDAQLREGPSGTLDTEKSRSAENAPIRDFLEPSEAAGVQESFGFTRIEESDLQAGPGRASCVVAGSTCGDENLSGVQLREELSRDLALDGSRSAEVVDGIDSSGAATGAVSPVPLLIEKDVSRAEGVVAGLMDVSENISDAVVPDKPSHAVPLHRLRSAGNIFIGSSETDGDSASPAPIVTEDDVLLSEIVVDKEVGHFRDAVDTGEGKATLRSFDPSYGQVLEERIQSPVQFLVTVKDRLEGQADLVDAGAALDLNFQTSHKQIDPYGDSVDVPKFNVCDVQNDCGVGNVSETDVTVSSDDVIASLSVERGLFLQKVVVDEHVDTSCDEELRDKGTVRKCSRQAALKQTENDSVLFIEEQNDEMRDDHKNIPRGNVPLESNLDFDVTEVALESELDISKGVLVHYVRTEEVVDNLNSNDLVEKLSSTLISPNGHFVRGESHPTLAHSGTRSFCSEGMSEPKDVVAVLGSSWQAGRKPAEDINSMARKDEEDNSSYTQVLEDCMGQDARSTEGHLMDGNYGCGSQSCVGSKVLRSNTVTPHDNGNLVDLGRIHTDGRDHMVCLTEDKLEQEHMLLRPEGSSEFAKRSEVEQYKTPEIQIVVTPFSESRAVNMGLVFCRSSHEEFPATLLPLVEAGMRNEVERVPENHVGEVVNCATDSVKSVDPADHVLSTHPDTISEGLRLVSSRDSDATISDSQESAQGTGAELVAGIELQSPLVMKSKGNHVGHLHEPEDSHSRHLEDLENPLTRHLDDLDENEELPYASPLTGAVHDQLVRGGVRPHKKKARLHAYNHEKSIRGTGRSHFHPLGSKKTSHLQKPDNRCRRKRHIYPDQPVPVFIEGRDEGFEEADGSSFMRWLAHQDGGNAARSPALGKWVCKRGPELVKPIIAIPSFRVVSGYEDKQQDVEKRRKLGMQPQPISSSRLTLVSSSTLQPLEYDMDDEDEEWLHAWNKRLTRDGLKQPISEDKFEEMIEYFERRSAEMIVSAAGVFPGFPHCGKSLAQPVPAGSLPRACPSGLGVLSTNLATSGSPVSGNSPTLNPPAITTGHPPGLKDVLGSGRQAMVSSCNRVDRNSFSPASRVRFHTLVSENERNPSNSNVGAVCERPRKGSLRKSLKPSALVKISDDCCICNGGEDDDNNPVYTCKRCLIYVHQSCYGIREKFRDDDGRVIAPSNWCCRKCEAVAVGSAQPNVSCALCRKRGGALKPTVVAQKWAHVACALYTNETFFVDPDAMEPIDGIAAVAARSQELQERCELCGVKKGICSLCAVKDCRAPFHISCGVSQGASFELRQSKQKVVGVRSFCPRHARATAVDSAPSAELMDRHMLSSSGTSGATSSATASGSISTTLSMDDREEWSSRQSISHPDGSFGDPAGIAKSVGREVDLSYNVKSVNGKIVEDAGGAWSKGIRFAFKRGWHESCDQASEGALSSDCQKKCGDGTGVSGGVSGGKVEAPGCKSTWQGVEPGQKLKKIKFKFGRFSQNLDSQLSPTLVHHEMIGSEVPQAQKMKDVMHAVGDLGGDAGINERDTEFLEGLSQDRFANEVKELMIFEEAMKSGVAPGCIMREVFVYWRAKRSEFKGSLLSELHHEQWLRSQGIFNKDASDEERAATGKIVSSLRVPQAQQPSPMSNEKTLNMAKEIRMQLEHVRWMAQMVVQREKLKYSRQFVLGSLASVELNRAQEISEERHCVWCPSIKTLLKCGTCPRCFCFNCFKHRKGFGVKGWMTAMKQPMYICNYCRGLSSEQADLSKYLDPALKEIEEGGAVSTPKNTSGPAIGVVSTSVTWSKHAGGGRGNGMGKGRVKGRSWNSPGSGLLGVAKGTVMSASNNSVDATEGMVKRPEIGLGNGNCWTASDNARFGSPRCGSEARERNQSKPSQREDGLDKFLSSAHSQIEHSSFETTLRRLKILRCTNVDSHQDVVTDTVEIPSRGIAPRRGTDGLEGMKLNTIISGNLSVPSFSGSGPALLVYKKKRKMIISKSLESPPSAYDLGDQPCSPRGLENGT